MWVVSQRPRLLREQAGLSHMHWSLLWFPKALVRNSSFIAPCKASDGIQENSGKAADLLHPQVLLLQIQHMLDGKLGEKPSVLNMHRLLKIFSKQ